MYIELDSSTRTKFSRHLIVSLPGETYFRNNLQVGDFVTMFCDKISEEADFATNYREIPAKVLEARKLFIWHMDKNNNFTKRMYVDRDVYTSNRNMRIVLSAKFVDVRKRHLQVFMVNLNKKRGVSLIQDFVFEITSNLPR